MRDEFAFWLLDFELPDGSALDLLPLRRVSTDGPRAVVVISNYATRLMRRRCLAAGADHVLDKTRDFEELPDLISATAEGTVKGHA